MARRKAVPLPPYVMEGATSETTLAAAKEFLLTHFRTPRGGRCPCCGRRVAANQTKLCWRHALLLRDLAKLGEEYVHLEGFVSTMQYEVRRAFKHPQLLTYWGLLEELPGEATAEEVRGGAKSDSMHRITPLGRAFVRGEATVPKTKLMYNLKSPSPWVRDMEDTPQITFSVLRGQHFSAEEQFGE